MGLSVTAYRGLQKIDCVFDTEGFAIDPQTREPLEVRWYQPYVSSDFPSQAKGLEHGTCYSYQKALSGWSGGYHLYNQWREQLAKLAGYSAVPFERIPGRKSTEIQSHQVGAFEHESGPFLELICFSDCDGVIGPEVSAKLAQDFAAFDTKAKAQGAWFYEKYVEWQACFELATDHGAVHFH